MIGELKSRGFKRVLADSALAMLSPVIILGCIYTGVASPIEVAADDRNEEKIEEIQKSGTQILTLDEMTRTEMKQASAGVREAIRKKVSKKIADAYMGEK